jgi:hypothetical protein
MSICANPQCGNEFEPRYRLGRVRVHKYCSSKCRKRARYIANPEKTIAATKAWQKANPERVRMLNRERSKLRTWGWLPALPHDRPVTITLPPPSYLGGNYGGFGRGWRTRLARRERERIERSYSTRDHASSANAAGRIGFSENQIPGSDRGSTR